MSSTLTALKIWWKKADEDERSMDYYEEKRQDSLKQAGLLMWLMLIAIVFGACYCSYKWITHKCPEPGSVQTVQKGE